MTNFRVLLDFKSGASFESIIAADTKQHAIDRMSLLAKQCGFNSAVKKTIVVPA